MSRRYSNRVFGLLKDYRRVAISVKEIVKRFDPNARVFVFGSVVRGKFTGASDIDILIVTERIDLKYEIIVSVYQLIDAPVELHVVTKEQLINWYSRFISLQELEEA